MMQESPFKQPTGPRITPKTMGAAGQGGQQNPPYLQMRTPTGGAPGATQPSNMTHPVITPGPSAMGDTVNPTPVKTTTSIGRPPMAPPITPAGTPPQQGGNSLGDLYSFMKSDLQNQTKQAKSSAIADASNRGVYYGTPLTGSEADIDTQYLRGLGELDSRMYGNEQSNQLARLGMAAGLAGQGMANAPQTPGPLDFSGLGALFGSSSNNPTTPIGSAPRQGPVITKNGEGGKPVKTQSY